MVVGPVLEASDLGRAIAEILLRHNGGARLRDQGAYLRVECAERCRLDRADVEQTLGRPFRLPGELEQLMPSFRGQLRVSEDSVEWLAT